jgi:Predicted integral membrane protein
VTPPEEARPLATAGRTSLTKKLGSALRVLFLVAVVAFASLFVARRWGELRQALADVAWPLVVGSALSGAFALFLSLVAWRGLLAEVGPRLPLRVASRVFFVGQLGKYLPGSVWSVLAQAELARAHRVPRSLTFMVSALFLILSVGVGTLFAIVLLPFASPEAIRRYWWVVLAIPLYLVALHPRIIGWGMRLLTRILRRGEFGQPPSYSGLLRATAWQVLVWAFYGLHAWLLVLAFGGHGMRALYGAAGGFALAFCLGVLFVPVPAGAGVRDVALGVALGPLLAAPQALAVTLVSRIVLVFLDFAFAGAQWFVGGKRVQLADDTTVTPIT